MKNKIICTFFILVIFFTSCFDNTNDYKSINEYKYISNTDNIKELKKKIKKLYNYYFERGKIVILIQKLGQSAELINRDDFKSYLFFYISNIYWETGNKELACNYMIKVDKKYYNIDFNYNPIGYYIAQRIIKSNHSSGLKIEMYDLLLTDYDKIIDSSNTLYELSELYKKDLQYNKTIKIYKKLISNYGYSLSQNIKIQNLRNEIYFYNSKKSWLYQDLETLITNIKNAIKTRNKSSLYYYKSKRKFDIKLFQKENLRNWSYYELRIHNRWNNRITFSNKLEDFSSENEAYLKISNWNFPNMRTWYFKFSKFFYPYDNKINGSWEWTGIYFGDPLTTQ